MAESTACLENGGSRSSKGDPCRVSWCTRTVNKYARTGLCDPCREWSRRHGGANPESPSRRRLQPPPPDGRCTVVEDGERCPDPHLAKGKCKNHWQREYRNGDMTRRRRPAGELLALVQEAAQTTSDECLLAPCEHSRPSLIYRGEPMGAARAVWIEATGEDPGEELVLHTCHRGDDGCINFRHLYLGDHDQNMQDMVDAGRAASGEANGNAELTEDQVRVIRKEYATGLVSQRALARRFGVSQGTISQIVNRKTWTHIE